MREDAILGLVLISSKDLVEGQNVETDHELSDCKLIQLKLNCKRDKCRYLTKTWDCRTANLEKMGKIPEADMMDEPNDDFYLEILEEAANNNCQSKDLFKVNKARSNTLCLKQNSGRRGVVMLIALGPLLWPYCGSEFLHEKITVSCQQNGYGKDSLESVMHKAWYF